jgi:hypothetical protein
MALMAIRPPLLVTPGEANPRDAITLSGAVQDLPVLQVRLSTAGKTIRLSRVSIAFTDRMGADDQLETLRAHVVRGRERQRPDGGR